MSRPKINPETIEKTCPVCLNSFEVSFCLRNKRTYCSKKCANHSPSVINKMVQSQAKTFLDKYGMHPMKTEQTRQNLKKSIQEKYGVNWISKSFGWSKKMKETKLQRYQNPNFNNTPKRIETCIKKYGVPSYTQTSDYKTQYKQTCLKSYGKECVPQSSQFKIEHYKTMFEKFMANPEFINFDPCFSLEQYKGISNGPYQFKCKRCNSVQLHSLCNGRRPICTECDKLNSSYFQKEVFDYVREILGKDVNIQMNDRTVIHPKEIDILIPHRKLGIECNGLVWHSEIIGRKQKLYHKNKTMVCLARGIRIIHIFDNEWRFKKDIVKSILCRNLGGPSVRIYARDCEIRNVSSKEASKFLLQNHLQGTDHSSVKIGLFNNNELVSLMTFVKSRFDKKCQWELSRYCNKLNYHISGGATKLFIYFRRTYNPESVVSYGDLRYFDGRVYEAMEFKFIKNTSPNYHYIIDNYQNIQNRVSWQKHKLAKKLPSFDATLTEWENMKNNGFDRIWDCGNTKWIWSK